jgi:hypothetical protein
LKKRLAILKKRLVILKKRLVILKERLVILSEAKNPSPRAAITPETALGRDSSVAFGSLRKTSGGSSDFLNGLLAFDY